MVASLVEGELRYRDLKHQNSQHIKHWFKCLNLLVGLFMPKLVPLTDNKCIRLLQKTACWVEKIP